LSGNGNECKPLDVGDGDGPPRSQAALNPAEAEVLEEKLLSAEAEIERIRQQLGERGMDTAKIASFKPAPLPEPPQPSSSPSAHAAARAAAFAQAKPKSGSSSSGGGGGGSSRDRGGSGGGGAGRSERDRDKDKERERRGGKGTHSSTSLLNLSRFCH
jgi:hypothetical protein